MALADASIDPNEYLSEDALESDDGEGLIEDDDYDVPSEVESESDEENAEGKNAGWADSISKILKTNKPKNKKSLVLSKSKFGASKKEAGLGFEIIEGDEAKVKVETDAADENEEPPAKKPKEKETLPDLKVKPTVLDRQRERLLCKIATRGVVQLFNAVRNQQKDLEKKVDDAGPLVRKKEKAMKTLDKAKFLDMLMGETKSENVNKKLTEVKQSEVKKEEPAWDVFRDDFMMGAKMKDWDKKQQSDQEDNDADDSESD